MKIAFVGAKVYPVTSLPIENGIVLVENGKIVKVGTNLSTDGYEIIDCNDLHLTPGFVDCHTHTGIWEEGSGPGPGNNDGNELSDSITPYVRVLDAIHPEDVGFGDARKGGVTTLGITHGSANAIGGQISVAKSTGTIADDMVILQPAGLKFAMGENPKRVGDWKNRAPTTRMGVAALIRKAFYEARDYEEEWEQYKWQLEFEEKQPEDKRKRVKKPKYDYGKEILLKVLRREIPVRNHAHRADDIITAIRLSEEFGYRLIVDHATESIKVKERIVEKNIPIA
ncbi:MAG: amidohydrolase, partial [Candidatus Heimdallarchaeota archaeon]|nr:amidohydrolase [Candidatus Heimdallarchaeota archaeon]